MWRLFLQDAVEPDKQWSSKEIDMSGIFFLILALCSLVIGAISGAMGLTGNGWQILDAIKKLPTREEKQKFIWSIAIITLLLTVIFTLVGIPSFLSLVSQSGPGNTPSPSPGNSQVAISVATATFTPPSQPTLIPTTVPPTPTPPPQCTDREGIFPNGPVATKLMINCTLPAGSVALISVCNEAHLIHPFDVPVQGAGIISYQSSATEEVSLSIEAENTALANAPCRAKFFVVSPDQVDGKVTQEVQRLKNLIGNNPNVTYKKVVGEDIEPTTY